MSQIQTKWIADSAITTAKINDGAVTGAKLSSTVAIPSTATATTQSAGNNSTAIATTAYVDSAVGGLGDVLTLKGALDASLLGSQLDNTQAGDYWRVTVAGTIFGTNPITLAVGDALITINDQVGTPTDGANFLVIDNTELDDQDATQVPLTAGYDSSTATGNVLTSDSVEVALEKIEKKADTNASSISTNANNISTNTTDIGNLEAALGSSTGIAGMDYTSTNYVTVDTTAIAAISALDAQVATNASNISTNAAHATGDGSDHQDVVDLVTLSGVAANSVSLGTFTGTTIPDTQTIKAALQALETAVETKADSSVVTEIDGNVNDLITLSGVAENATDLGTFTGVTIADASTIKAALQALETEVETKAASSVVTEIDANVDDLITLSGVAENASNLGTFTGSTIADSSTIKAALQALETGLESAVGSTNAEEVFTLAAGDITNGYVELAQQALAASIIVTPVGGPMQLAGTDFTVSVPVAVTRITFAGDLAAQLVATDKLIVKYEY